MNSDSAMTTTKFGGNIDSQEDESSSLTLA